MSEEATVKVAVRVTRNPGRSKEARYTAAYGDWPRDISADGATAAEAKANLAAAVNTALRTILDGKPTFARDDQGGMWAAVPAYDGGSNWWRVTDEEARRNTSSSRPTSEAFASCTGMTVIPKARWS